MPHRRNILITTLFLGTLLADERSTGAAWQQRPLAGPSSDTEIARLVSELGDDSYEARTFATRRLIAIGKPAASALQTAASGDNMEVALRARALLRDFDRVLFSGVDIHLAFTKPRITWDESVDLVITMVNRSAWAATVPFAVESSDGMVVTGDAKQVGAMLDVADLLRVRRRTDGKDIALTVDDIALDADVASAVRARLDDTAMGVIAPGERAVFTIPAFNRGWARYRFLDADAYTVVLDYTPPWSDRVLAEQRIGRVASPEATITITRSIPETVSRGGEVVSIVIRRDVDGFVSEFTNRTDQPMFVNRNFGPSVPFARGRWIWESGGTSGEIAVGPAEAVSWHGFDEALLTELAPGGAIELARLSTDAVRKGVKGIAADPAGGTIHFDYSNLCDRIWQSRQGSALLGNPSAPVIFRSPLPRRIQASRHTSNTLVLPTQE